MLARAAATPQAADGTHGVPGDRVIPLRHRPAWRALPAAAALAASLLLGLLAGVADVAPDPARLLQADGTDTGGIEMRDALGDLEVTL